MSYARVCPQCLSRICAHVLPPPTRVISIRESQVLRAMANGLCNKDIATALGLTVPSTKVYINRLMRKLAISTRLEAILWARDHVDLLSGIPRAAPLSQPSEAPKTDEEPEELAPSFHLGYI